MVRRAFQLGCIERFERSDYVFGIRQVGRLMAPPQPQQALDHVPCFAEDASCLPQLVGLLKRAAAVTTGILLCAVRGIINYHQAKSSRVHVLRVTWNNP
jgi:hypothetical protein